MNIAEHANRRQILWVNNLRTSRHLNNKVLKSWAQDQITSALGGLHDDASLLTNNGRMWNKARVTMKLSFIIKSQQITSLLAVNEKSFPLTRKLTLCNQTCCCFLVTTRVSPEPISAVIDDVLRFFAIARRAQMIMKGKENRLCRRTTRESKRLKINRLRR